MHWQPIASDFTVKPIATGILGSIVYFRVEPQYRNAKISLRYLSMWLSLTSALDEIQVTVIFAALFLSLRRQSAVEREYL